jgi:hypothetical protein
MALRRPGGAVRSFSTIFYGVGWLKLGVVYFPVKAKKAPKFVMRDGFKISNLAGYW